MIRFAHSWNIFLRKLHTLIVEPRHYEYRLCNDIFRRSQRLIPYVTFARGLFPLASNVNTAWSDNKRKNMQEIWTKLPTFEKDIRYLCSATSQKNWKNNANYTPFPFLTFLRSRSTQYDNTRKDPNENWYERIRKWYKNKIKKESPQALQDTYMSWSQGSHSSMRTSINKLFHY